MNYISTQRFVHLLVATVVLFLTIVLFVPTFTFAQTVNTTDTVFLELKKIVSPAHFSGTLDASDFFFTISGNGVNQTINHGETIELAVGTYSVTEGYGGSDPVGFNPADWTALWAGDICVGENIPATEAGTLSVLAGDVGKYVENNPGRCNAENQFKPGSVQVSKVVVGTSTNPDAFSFTINGGSVVSFESDGSNDVDIPAGDYEIVEVADAAYTTTYSAGCSGTVANNENVSCAIINTYIDPGIVLGCTDPLANNYNALATQDDGLCTYPVASSTTGSITGIVWNDANGNGLNDNNESVLPGWAVVLQNATGTVLTSTTTNAQGEYTFGDLDVADYIVCETLQSGWSQIFPVLDGCHTVTVIADSVVSDVNFGNQQNGGGGSSDPDTYRIEGYVWHDDNENTQWDGFENEDPTEEEQSGWTVEITNGSSTFSTQTDESGYYSFEVEAGTWTITEVVQDGWALITPVTGSHVVTVPDVTLTLSFSEKVMAFLVPTAHAAVLGTYGPFDFGNNESETTGGGSGGCFNCISSRGGGSPSSGGDSFPDVTAVPQVLGDQVTIVPVGAPNAGAGGTAPIATTFFDLILLTGSILVLLSVRRYTI